ncbi:MAG: gliding motility ABC transporter [Bdellovibrio sp.]|nr:MAG: gliding motility ABC transporter [Bdellovibrio sp.]
MSQLAKILLFLSGISLGSFGIVRVILGTWVPFLWIMLAFFVVFAAAGFWVDRKFFGEFFAMKTTKQGMSMGTMILLVFTLMVAVNVLGFRRYVTWDFSMNKINSLSDQSVQLLKGLKDDLKVIYFYKEGTEGVEQNRHMFIELMRKYQDQSPKVKLEFVEVNQNPALTEKYNIKKGTQSVILEYQGRTNLIEKIDEQEITSALVKATREKDKMVYTLTGHQEMPLERQQDGSGISFLKDVLEGNRYQVKPFQFSESGQVPKDADVLLILGPQQPFLEVEIKALENFLRGGGNVFIALRPHAQHGLDGFLKNLGIKLSNNVAVTVMEIPGIGRAMDPKFTRASSFSSSHSVTKPFGKDEFVVFRLPQPLEREGATPPNGYILEDLAKSGPNSMAFTSTSFDNEAGHGPFTFVEAVKGKFPAADGKTPPDAKEFNLILAGDSNFLNDATFYQYLNRDLFLNSLSFLAKDETLISVTPKEVARTQIEMTPAGLWSFVIFVMIPIPFLLYALGGALWFRRRYS